MPGTPEAAAATAADPVLAFDFGTRRIGVAVGTSLTGQARPLTVLHAREQPDWDAIESLLREWRPRALVVGLPLAKDGGEQPLTKLARAFMAQLRVRFERPVHAVDERYSSLAAESELRAQRASGRRPRKLQKGDTDAQAAQIILQTWFNGAPP